MIQTEQIKKLRDETGVSVMLCRKALEEANGDFAKAKEVLKRCGAEAAAKKSGRTLGAGTIESYLHNRGKVGVLVEVASETDFVAGNEGFKSLAHDIAMHIAATNPETVEALLLEPFIKDEKQSIKELVEGAIQKFGEKIEIVRFTRFSA